MLKNFFGEDIPKTIFIDEKELDDLTPRNLYGKYFSSSQIFNIFPNNLKKEGKLLGKIIKGNKVDKSLQLCGIVDNKKIRFFSYGKEAVIEPYNLYQNIFSRNTGILETKVMSNKCAVIIGCGSVGSLVAMELARSGLGNFLLIDADVLNYHNLCRHQCGIDDVGDLKINALERKILKINPSAKIDKFEGIFQNVPKEKLDAICGIGKTIFVGCADNRSADVYSNRIAIYYNSPFISIGFWERALAGEIFYYLPNKNMPCYSCALGDGGGLSGRSEGSHHVYSMQENVEAVKFEPGISVDINFITCIGIKLILDILNDGENGYIPRLLNDLRQYTLVCNTSNPKIGGEMVEIFSYPLQVTTSLKVGFGTCCKEVCKFEKEPK